MLTDQKIMAFVATADAPKARSFYQELLGLKLVSDDDYALVFDAAGTMLRVQKAQTVTPAPYTALGWQVEQITRTVRELVARGVQFERFGFLEQDELGIWTAPSGARIAWFKDPDGNVLSLTQF